MPFGLSKYVEAFFIVASVVFLIYFTAVALSYGLHAAKPGLGATTTKTLPVNPSVDVILSLPYLFTVNTTSKVPGGVTLYDENLSYPGLNLFTYYEDGAYLVDMRGRIVYNWSYNPESPYASLMLAGGLNNSWETVRLGRDGSLYVLEYTAQNMSVARLDWDSNPVWINKGEYHHDVDVSAEGAVVALKNRVRNVTRGGGQYSIVDNDVVVFTPDGTVLRSLSVYDLLGDRLSDAEFLRLYESVPRTPYPDILHSNTVSFIEEDRPYWRKGNLLVCVRNLNTVFIVDAAKGKVVWSWGPGFLDLPHKPVVLEDGNILVLDNGASSNRSRVVEYDPVRNETVWVYDAFYTQIRGGVQKLPNGNVLITESQEGRAFEVTVDGRTVWEYYAPLKESGERYVIYRMSRITPEQLSEMTLPQSISGKLSLSERT